jgi:hypothetical protein
MRTKRLIAASGVAGLLLLLASSFGAHAGLWCPPPIPGVPIRTCLCEYITGRAEVSSPTPLSALALFGLRRDLTQRQCWIGRAASKCAVESADFFRPVGCGLVMERDTAPRPGVLRAATSMLATPRRGQARAVSGFAEEWSASTSCYCLKLKRVVQPPPGALVPYPPLEVLPFGD